jgi:pyridoxamine 5'-phosphate oxidase
MNANDLADIRRDYSLKELSEESVERDPFAQFSAWLNDAINSGMPEPTAMNVATVNRDGQVSSRVVLLKGFDKTGFVFFTNYESQKGRELTANPNCALHFFWPELERQINIRGHGEKVSRDESETYFKSRPFESRIGAWASAQSTAIGSRDVLKQKVDELREQYSDAEVPLPPFWGGFRVVPDRFEFWQGRPSRLHDRIVYELLESNWTISRLSP